jgi:hypothetical protein
MLRPDSRERWGVVRINPSGQRTIIAADLTLSYGQGVAEDYVRLQGAGGLVNPRARWRREPASAGQLHMLRRLRIPSNTGLTKGGASDLITQARFVRTLRLGNGVVHAS